MANCPTVSAHAPYAQKSGGRTRSTADPDTTSVIYNDHCLTTVVSSSSTAAESILTPATRTKRLAIKLQRYHTITYCRTFNIFPSTQVGNKSMRDACVLMGKQYYSIPATRAEILAEKLQTILLNTCHKGRDISRKASTISHSRTFTIENSNTSILDNNGQRPEEG